jgi:hypothetical protein
MMSPKIIDPASAKATRTRITAESETLTTVSEIAAKLTMANRSTPPNSKLLDDLRGFRDILLRTVIEVLDRKEPPTVPREKIPIPLNSHDQNTTVSSSDTLG